VLGLAAHATHFVTLAATLGILLLLHGLKKGRLWLFLSSGLAFGLAVLMKQAGVFLGIYGGLFLLFHGIRISAVGARLLTTRALVFSAGAILPTVVTAGALQLAGVFDSFKLWTLSYAREYAGLLSASEGRHEFIMNFTPIVSSAPLIWLLALVGFIVLLASRGSRQHAVFVGGFTLFSSLAVFPGLYFRPHYFIVLLPAVGLLAGVAIQALERRFLRAAPKGRWLPLVAVFIAAIAIGHTLKLNRSAFFDLSPAELSRGLYGASPFPESLQIAEYIRENSSLDARVAVIGSEPQIYFYSGRRSATGHIYTYPLMEAQSLALDMQQEMIAEIERNGPEFFVYVNVGESWLARKDSHQLLFHWFHEYRKEHLELVGYLEVIDARNTRVSWGPEARDAKPVTPNWMTVYRARAPIVDPHPEPGRS
jgi:hypothetical protein